MKPSPAPLPALAEATSLPLVLAGGLDWHRSGPVGHNGVRIVRAVDLLQWWVPLSFLSGVAAADFASGLVHWAADTWGRADLPVIGPRFLVPFRVHHMNPDDFIRRRFLDRHYSITTGWSNRPLEAIRFFRLLEIVISGSTGARPRADEEAFAAGSRHVNSEVKPRV